MSAFRPMLAVHANFKQIDFPKLASPKLDGIRGVQLDGKALTRSLKPVPNKHVYKTFSRLPLRGLDGEYAVGPVTDHDLYRRTNSALMTLAGQPDPTFWVFDDFSNPDLSLVVRLETASKKVERAKEEGLSIELLDQVMVYHEEQLLELEELWLDLGFEGLILRDPGGKYKFGRSTLTEGGMLKLKRFLQSEIRILGVIELLRNDNVPQTNELGYMERSSHKENKVPMGMMGALHVIDVFHGWEFDIGTGFTEEDRIMMWKNKEALIGTYGTYKYFPIGMKDLPRHPVWIGPKSVLDMSPPKF